jgi:hypothetical protein
VSLLRIVTGEKDPVKVSAAINQTAEYIDTTVRKRLTTATTFYVRTDGSDANTGTINSAAGAWLTLQHAMDMLAGSYDFGGQDVTVQIGNGTYSKGVNLAHWTGAGTLTWLGDNSTPSNVVIAPSAGSFSTGCCFLALNSVSGTVFIKGMKLTTTGSGYCCILIGASTTIWSGNIEFGPCVQTHVFVQGGGLFGIAASYTISGGAVSHFFSGPDGNIQTVTGGWTVTVTGTPAFSSSFALSRFGYMSPAGTTFSGAATGGRYLADQNSVINTGGGGANYFPGNVAGTTASGGQYI